MLCPHLYETILFNKCLPTTNILLLYLFLHNSVLYIVNGTIVGNITGILEINLTVVHIVLFAVVLAEGP